MNPKQKTSKLRLSLKEFWKLFKGPLTKQGIFEPNGRQPYIVGRLKRGINFDKIKKRLEMFGFEKPKLEWRDLGQIFSARLMEGDWQYHLRIFKDGEVRGHLELAPKHPLRHITARTRQPCPSFFLILLNEFLIH